MLPDRNHIHCGTTIDEPTMAIPPTEGDVNGQIHVGLLNWGHHGCNQKNNSNDFKHFHIILFRYLLLMPHALRNYCDDMVQRWVKWHWERIMLQPSNRYLLCNDDCNNDDSPYGKIYLLIISYKTAIL